MDAFVINGIQPLYGCVKISGAKNAVLPILAATICHGGKYVLHNCPDIADVRYAVQILRTLGAQVTRVDHVLSVDTRDLCRWVIPAGLMMKMRASVLFLGPLLARFGRAVLTMPGGCPLGRRPIDLHLRAVSCMGAAVTMLEEQICCCTSGLHGCDISFDFPSVGATENAVMAAVGCCGTVTIHNAAREPEVCDLIAFLQAMGADIRGAGTDIVTVCGGAPLHDADHTVMADRIEAATYLCACAGCGGKIALDGAQETTLQPVADVLRSAGCKVWQRENALCLESNGELCAVGCIETAPYPGFPTDAQALVAAALLRADGQSKLSETIFENRFGYVSQLQRLGAQIGIVGSTAVISGVRDLRPAKLEACDLRAAAALMIAAMQTQGESTVFGLKHLYRGYDNPEAKFCSLGARIRLIQ